MKEFAPQGFFIKFTVVTRTEKYEDQNNGGKSSDDVEHHVQSLANYVDIFAVLHQHRWKEETDRYAQLKTTRNVISVTSYK